MPLDQLTTDDHTGRKILLLDLVWTLGVRRGGGGGNYSKVIWETETYRESVIDRVLEEGFYVIILTARETKYQKVTLDNIRRHTRWQPDMACFNDDGVAPEIWKQRALHRLIFPKFGYDRERFFALESNNVTRAMYAKEGVAAKRWEDYLGVPKQTDDLQGILPGFDFSKPANQEPQQ